MAVKVRGKPANSGIRSISSFIGHQCKKRGQPLKLEIGDEFIIKYGYPPNTLPGYSLLLSSIPYHTPSVLKNFD